jgi:general secretion pathway protein J
MPIAKPVCIQFMKQQGFTLLELLIASTIFAIMAVMAYGGLNNVINNSGSSEQALKRLQQVQQSISLISRDLSQIVPRNIRDEYGNKQPYLSAGSNIDYLVEFTRGGRVNPANLLRSTLLRIAYQFEDEKLIRLQWPQLDSAPGTEAKKTVIIDNVESVTLRFLDQNAESHDQWPPLNASTGANSSPQALSAIEIILQLNDWGEIRRLYAMK